MKINQSVRHFDNVENAKIAIVISQYNDSLGNLLLKNVLATLTKHHLKSKNISTFQVPGALEIPFFVNKLIHQQPAKFDAIITLGIVIKGDTYHFELVCNESYRALMDLNLSSPIPIIFGILTVNNVQQALTRVEQAGLNKGEEFALSALEMITLNKKL